MLRTVLFMSALLAVEAVVVLHWYVLPHSAALEMVALAAAAMMTAMAAADVVLLAGVLRRDPAHAQQRRELEDLAHIEPSWVVMTLLQFAFIAAAAGAGVTWLAAVLVVGHAAELAAIGTARVRTRRPPASPARAA